MSSEQKTLKVYESINAVAAALAKTGIAKDRQGTGQFNYKFRGIDDVYAALAPLLADNKLCILPNVLERTCELHATKSGSNLFYVAVKVRFDVVSALDGSSHSIMTMGEAMDSGDKATNKAMSAAYKYAAFMTFCIPTEGDNDTENHTHEVASRPPAQSPQPVEPPDLKTRAEGFRAHLSKMTTEISITNAVAANGKLFQELKEKLPEEYEATSQHITRIQDAIRVKDKK